MRSTLSVGRQPKGEYSQAVRDLESLGYRDSFKSVEDVDDAKIIAKKFRSEGFFARIIEITSIGRVYNRSSIRVYIKEKKI